jgi:hypothetical protein
MKNYRKNGDLGNKFVEPHKNKRRRTDSLGFNKDDPTQAVFHKRTCQPSNNKVAHSQPDKTLLKHHKAKHRATMRANHPDFTKRSRKYQPK